MLFESNPRSDGMDLRVEERRLFRRYFRQVTLSKSKRDALQGVAAALLVTVVVEWNVWSRHGIVGTHVAGPRPLTAALPFLLAWPLLWRRRFPLAVVGLVMAGTAAQAIASGNSAEGLEFLGPFAITCYSTGAFTRTRRRALVGAGIFVAGYVIYAVEDQSVRNGTIGEWAGAFFGVCGLAFWLVGVFVRSHRELAELAQEAAKIERAAGIAIADERSRIARELHDVIAHNVSVIGLQAGAAERVLALDPERAREPLRAIQDSARDSVHELRRLLGILREGEEQPAQLTPQPRLAALPLLLEQVRTAGVDVDLHIEGDPAPMPPGVELSAYRIVQEALTNVLKHANATRADVQLRFGDRSLELEVTDNGTGADVNGTGHGLIGMRERAALYGGTVSVSRRPEGGFSVRAVLPREAAQP
jgi:signal transduction histidine kinase